MILTFIKAHNLLGILREYSIINTKGRYDAEIKANAIKSISIIYKRFDNTTQELILK